MKYKGDYMWIADKDDDIVVFTKITHKKHPKNWDNWQDRYVKDWCKLVICNAEKDILEILKQ